MSPQTVGAPSLKLTDDGVEFHHTYLEVFSLPAVAVALHEFWKTHYAGHEYARHLAVEMVTPFWYRLFLRGTPADNTNWPGQLKELQIILRSYLPIAWVAQAQEREVFFQKKAKEEGQKKQEKLQKKVEQKTPAQQAVAKAVEDLGSAASGINSLSKLEAKLSLQLEYLVGQVQGKGLVETYDISEMVVDLVTHDPDAVQYANTVAWSSQEHNGSTSYWIHLTPESKSFTHLWSPRADERVWAAPPTPPPPPDIKPRHERIALVLTQEITHAGAEELYDDE